MRSTPHAHGSSSHRGHGHDHGAAPPSTDYPAAQAQDLAGGGDKPLKLDMLLAVAEAEYFSLDRQEAEEHFADPAAAWEEGRRRALAMAEDGRRVLADPGAHRTDNAYGARLFFAALLKLAVGAEALRAHGASVSVGLLDRETPIVTIESATAPEGKDGIMASLDGELFEKIGCRRYPTQLAWQWLAGGAVFGRDSVVRRLVPGEFRLYRYIRDQPDDVACVVDFPR